MGGWWARGQAPSARLAPSTHPALHQAHPQPTPPPRPRTCHPRLVCQKEAISSSTNNRPPTGAEKAVATPVAAPGGREGRVGGWGRWVGRGVVGSHDGGGGGERGAAAPPREPRPQPANRATPPQPDTPAPPTCRHKVSLVLWDFESLEQPAVPAQGGGVALGEASPNGRAHMDHGPLWAHRQA